MSEELSSAHFVSLFRSVAPYVNLFRGKTFVIAFGGRAISGSLARTIAYDANLLAALGVRLVLVQPKDWLTVLAPDASNDSSTKVSVVPVCLGALIYR